MIKTGEEMTLGSSAPDLVIFEVSQGSGLSDCS